MQVVAAAKELGAAVHAHDLVGCMQVVAAAKELGAAVLPLEATLAAQLL